MKPRIRRPRPKPAVWCFFALLLLALCALVLSGLNVVVFPAFRHAPFLLAAAAAVLGLAIWFVPKRSWLATLFVGLALLGGLFALDQLALFLNPREGHFEAVSPSGERTLVVEYDYVSRPSLYLKQNRFFMKPLPLDFGPGYNETVIHRVVWLSESTLLLEDPYGEQWEVDLEE